MTRKTASIVLAAMLSIPAVPAFAGDFSNGFKGSGERPRGGVGMGLSIRDAKPIAMPKLEPGETPRAAPMTEGAIVRSMTARGITTDGKEVTVEPTEKLRGVIRKELSGGTRSDTGKATSGPGKARSEESDRKVVGDDDRIQIVDTDAEEYPFRVVGQLQYVRPSGPSYCSAALIGPRTVLTAAHCLYFHDDGAWAKDFQFVPARTDANGAPYGVFDAETAYILDGYIANHDGTYGSVIPWDMGVVILKEPIGDSLGWLGYGHYDDLDGFTAEMAGYPSDMPQGTMWFSTCELIADQIATDWFQNDCDSYPGSSGSSVYAPDEERVIGVHVAGDENASMAVRLYPSYVEWLDGLVQ